jgi:hypothetical protein
VAGISKIPGIPVNGQVFNWDKPWKHSFFMGHAQLFHDPVIYTTEPENREIMKK